jgi:phage shock protein A
MANNLKFLLLLIVMLAPIGCGDDGIATVDVLKKRITNQIQSLVGKGDIAIQKYKNKIVEVRQNLVKVKVSRKTFERKLQTKKAQLAALEKSEGSEAKITILTNIVQEMEDFLQQLSAAEEKLGNTYNTLVANLDIVKLKVAALEAKRDMLDAMRSIQEYTNFEGDIDSIGGDMESTFEEMQREVYEIEAEIEVENLLSQANK